MSLIVFIELVGIYIILNYCDNLEVYTPMFLVSFSFVMIILGSESIISNMVLLGFWPGYMVYISWMSSIISSLKLLESFNKMIVFIVVSCIVISFNAMLLLFMLGFSVGGVLSVTTLGVYVSFSLITSLMSVMFLYALLGVFINLNYNILVIGVLPLPVFFVKVFGFWSLYMVMLLGVMVFLE